MSHRWDVNFINTNSLVLNIVFNLVCIVLFCVTRVVNLVRALDILDKKGFWIIGTSGDGPESIYRFDWNRDLVLVLGSEGKGLSRSVRDRCHQLVSIPALGNVDALNISIAGGVILSEIVRQRGLV